jgi:tetratricopeptide (TPR) repeat protein
MAIEGPLRELGIHDVFQLLDLSRKTGALRVTSALRDNEGVVHFHSGRIVAATIRSNPHPLGQFLVRAGRVTAAQLEEARALQLLSGEKRRIGDILVDLDALTARELERHVHRQIEAVVFELLSWQEGFFSFVESSADDLPADCARGVATEALLMESARRIDEWARIADLVPQLNLIPVYADVDAERPSRLELLPNEWEILVAVDGLADVRTVAAILGRTDFDVAKVVYGLVSTGVLTLRPAGSTRAHSVAAADDDPVMLLADAREALHDGRSSDALRLAERAAERAPQNVDALVDIARALLALERPSEAQAALTRALELDGAAVGALMLSARMSFQRGEAEGATRLWRRVLDAAPAGADADRAREAIAHVNRLTSLLEPTHA